MTRALETLNTWAVAILLVLTLLLAWTTDHYRKQAHTNATQLTELRAAVAAQNQTAARQLEELTRQRDARQAQLDALHLAQEQHDAETTQQIARLEHELATRPVRVRIAASPAACGPGGAGAADHATAHPDAGAANASETHGLLPAGNAARLGAVIAEMETINAAYASCRSRLLELRP